MKILLLLIILTSCGQDKKKSILTKKSQKELSGSVTLIFENAPEKIFISTKENNVIGGRSFYNYIASFIDSDGITQFISPKRKSYIDTVRISIRNPKVEIYFSQLSLEGLSYLFLNGDIAKVNYLKGKPKIQILNRHTKKYDYQFENIRENRMDGRLTIFEDFFRHISFPKYSKSLSKEQLDKFHKNNLQKNSFKLLDSLRIQIKLLDSLYDSDLLSKSIYNYYTKKIEYINWSRLAKTKKLNYVEQSKKIPIEDFKEYAFPLFSDLKGRSDKSTLESIIKSGDSLIRYKFYQDFLNDQFLPNYIENQTTKNSFNYGNFGGNYYQWNVVFDSIRQSRLFSEKIKEFLLYRYMDRISKDLSPKIIKEYYSKFIKYNNNSTYVDLINNKYSLDSTVTDKLILKDSLNNSYFLEDILKENLGKMIYIDFWASWCRPCIDAVPHKNRLRRDYKNKDLVFISISINKNIDEWKSSLSLESSNSLTHNYILKNPVLSKFIKNNHIIFVPRYLLYGKNGKLLDSNAPKPETNEIRVLLDKYLNK